MQSHPDFKDNGFACICEIKQAEPGQALRTCIEADVVTNVEGWCYVDPSQDPAANEALVAACVPGQKRLIRFVGNNIPAAGSLTFLKCE